MGTWSTGIFDNDLAMDVRATFEQARRNGLPVAEATERVLGMLSEAAEDYDDGAIILLALAALQLEEGAVQPDIRDKALEIVAAGQSLAGWEETGEGVLAERQSILEDLRRSLQSTQSSCASR